MNHEQFFIVTAPGLELLAERELNQFLDQGLLAYGLTADKNRKIRKAPGGLSLELPLDVGWLLNLHLKIPTRVLQRVMEFPARDYPKFFNKLRKWHWQKFLRQGDVKVKVASRASRLKMKEKLEKTTQEALADASEHQAFRKSFLNVPQSVFVRIENDLAIVSLDTSGAPLYQRGYKIKTVAAPIRETLASALFRLSLEVMTQRPQRVVDPMCGSGTLIFEALSHPYPIRSRHFAFENFPCAPEMKSWKPLKFTDKEPAIEGYGFDREPAALSAAQSNGELFEKKFSQKIQWQLPDAGTPNVRTLMMVNPPYDERLSADRSTVQSDIIQYLRTTSPQHLAIVWPGTEAPHLEGLVQWRSRILTRNGGLPVNLSVGEVRL